ncbi:MAG: hypothetical protein HYZ53_08545 [Planctomycetes bacterium]|nr:hypothetical protein [Planctomycetota bacterium]
MSKPSKRKVAPGQVRRSQVITTFGPGAMVDMPNHSVLIGGLEHWTADGRRVISEERLVAKVEALLNTSPLHLESPPVELADPNGPKTGIRAWEFPEWFVVQSDAGSGGMTRSRRLVHQRDLTRGRFKDEDGKARPLVPVRFVQACLNGHLSDIDWYGFAHTDYETKCRRALFLEERGASGDLEAVWVRCDCGAQRSLAQATRIADRTLGTCGGKRLWLGPRAGEKCGGGIGPLQPNRLLIRSASNAYFPQTLSVISIPDPATLVRKAVEPVWKDFLLYAESQEDVKRERRKAIVASAIEKFSDQEVFAEIHRRKGGGGAGGAGTTKTIKQAELEMLFASPESSGGDVPEGEFYARTMPLPGPESGLPPEVGRIVLVHRLREVIAQVGFTRFQPSMPDVDGELSLEVRRAPLAQEMTWLPAVENRGEGFFIGFNKDALTAWAARPEVMERQKQLRAGFQEWGLAHAGEKAQFPDIRYVLLHSLSHLLLTAVSMECGYAASSIRERVYASEAGCGILLYTGTADAEGTLGGLVQVGRRIAAHFQSALEAGGLCSNDPVCALHEPKNKYDEKFLLGAACHGCLLIAETSCERRNEFLDRALVVPTVAGPGPACFARGGV